MRNAQRMTGARQYGRGGKACHIQEKRGSRWWALLALLIASTGLFAQQSGGQTVAARGLAIGMNLEGFVDYGTEWAWLDIMKYARPWFSQNAGWVEGGKNAWDTGFADRIKYDSDGWPQELPMKFADSEGPQVLSTVWANTASMRQGRWVALYKGSGELRFDMDGRVESSAPGKVVFTLKAKDGILRMSVLSSAKNDPIRQISIVPEAFEKTFGDRPFDPDWLAKLEPFKTLRFMDWGATNDSPLVDWKDRSTVSRYTWTEGRGVPYEIMTMLANQAGKDIWVCVPHMANPAYVRSMALLFRDQVKPGTKVHVEYSNEIWNWIFGQTHWLRDNGSQQADWPERIVPFVQRALDIWTEVWAARKADLVRVVSIQTGWYDVARRVAGNLKAGSADALGATFYFAFDEKAVEKLKSLGSRATAADVAREARRAIDEVELPRLREIQKLANELKLRLVMYEGGQHLTPEPFGSEQPYNPALEAVQQSPAMYELYRYWLAKVAELDQARKPEGLLSMHFVLAAAVNGRYGSWGAVTDIHRGPPYKDWAPKYQALLEVTK